MQREKGASADLPPPLVIITPVTLKGAQVQSRVLYLLPAVPQGKSQGKKLPILSLIHI